MSSDVSNARGRKKAARREKNGEEFLNFELRMGTKFLFFLTHITKF